jgi:hypothetical protein
LRLTAYTPEFFTGPHLAVAALAPVVRACDEADQPAQIKRLTPSKSPLSLRELIRFELRKEKPFAG